MNMSEIIKFPKPYKLRKADDVMTPEDWERFFQQMRERRETRQQEEERRKQNA
jgi:hypothetical protein